MSIAVAVQKSGKRVLSCDTACYYGTRREAIDNLQRASKVKKIAKSLVGVVGSSIYGTFLDVFLDQLDTSPQLDNEQSILLFFLEFWKHLRTNCHLVSDRDSDDEETLAMLDAQFLISNGNGLFTVYRDLTVMKFARYCAIGSGDRYALGALHAVYDKKMSATQIARIGVSAAIHFDAWCGGNIQTFKSM